MNEIPLSLVWLDGAQSEMARELASALRLEVPTIVVTGTRIFGTEDVIKGSAELHELYDLEWSDERSGTLNAKRKCVHA
jgi:hypothetical protein